MAKKYIKNEKGIVKSITTDNLQLEKPLLNENYDIEVHNRNMDKIDNAIQEVKGKVDGLELKAEKVTITDTEGLFEATNVEDALLENKTIILNNTNLANQALTKANEAFQRGDNVKTQLVDKLISEGLDVSTNNSFEELIGSIALGKKWSSGIVAITSTKKSFVGSWGSLNSEYYAEVRGLNFKPSCIVLYSEAKALRTIYNYGETYKSKQIVTTNMITWGGGSSHSLAYFTDSPCLIENGSFIVPVNSINVTAPFDMSWIAYE